MSSLADSILSFCSQSPEARKYAETHLGRFVRTLELTPEGTHEDRLLEMGAYMQMTPALGKLGYGEVRGCYLGPPGRTDRKIVTSTDGETFRCEIDLFNAESDRYPYPDEHFATVVCCELLEHLSEDPMHMMAEINRILKPGGSLVLSTPNICSMRSVVAVLTSWHPGLFTQYTARHGGNAVEPRHAREYAPRDIGWLLEASGFSVERLETGAYTVEAPEQPAWALDLLKEKQLPTDLRDDVIHAVGKKVAPVQNRYPEWLYS
jgi:SAM-dependent methyltransferase